jgi:hypothetical protein
MTVHSNKVKGAAKKASNAATVFPTVHPAKGEPTAARRAPPGAGGRRRIDLAHLQITGDDAISLASAMQVVGVEPSGESPRADVSMPKSQVAPLENLDDMDSNGPDSASATGSAQADAPTRVMLELHRERGIGATPARPARDNPAIEPKHATKPRRDPQSKATLSGELDPCLVRLIAVWPRLPQKIRDAVAAIVNSMEQG